MYSKYNTIIYKSLYIIGNKSANIWFDVFFWAIHVAVFIIIYYHILLLNNLYDTRISN